MLGDRNLQVFATQRRNLVERFIVRAIPPLLRFVVAVFSEINSNVVRTDCVNCDMPPVKPVWVA